MPYRFATKKRDYSDFSSGRVFYSSPGQPVLPIRLTSEIFLRCLAIRHNNKQSDPVVLYDPCCGSAYHLTTLAFLHWPEIDTIIGSDVEADILSVAARNLSLLTMAGLKQRQEEIETMLARFSKPSHADALRSVQAFVSQLRELIQIRQIKTRLFLADATRYPNADDEMRPQKVDIILSDVPYGWHSDWQLSASAKSSRTPLWHMLSALQPVLSTNAVVAIVADKGQQVAHENYERIERFQIGKRQVVLLQQATA
jgi:23S rRNA (guanine2535-N1)-methyltransferase